MNKLYFCHFFSHIDWCHEHLKERTVANSILWKIVRRVDFTMGKLKSQNVLFHSPDWASAQKVRLHHYQTDKVWSKAMSHVFNNDKYYYLFFIHLKQLSLSSKMMVRKTLHIKSWIRFFRWIIYWSLDDQICALSS